MLWLADIERNWLIPLNLTVAQLVKKFPAFCGTQSFIAVLTKPATGPYTEHILFCHILIYSGGR
jgi:hypothetical protein